MANLGETNKQQTQQTNLAPTTNGASVEAEALKSSITEALNIKKELGLNVTDEVVITMGQTIMNNKQKNDRTTAIGNNKYSGGKGKSSTPKEEKFKPDIDVAYQVKIIEDRGIFTEGYGGHNFLVEVGGKKYVYTANTKNGVVIKDHVGKVLTITKESAVNSKGSKYTKYSIMDGTVKLI